VFRVIEIHRASSIVLMWDVTRVLSNKSLLRSPEDVFISFLFVTKTVEVSVFLEFFHGTFGRSLATWGLRDNKVFFVWLSSLAQVSFASYFIENPFFRR
jgi:hypothetical protein